MIGSDMVLEVQL